MASIIGYPWFLIKQFHQLNRGDKYTSKVGLVGLVPNGWKLHLFGGRQRFLYSFDLLLPNLQTFMF